LWRKLKKAGAVSLKTSASLLPDTPANYELFQWLAKQLNDGGGEATLIRAKEIESMSHAQVVALFNDSRAEDYADLAREVAAWLKVHRKKSDEAVGNELDRLKARFAEIEKIDFFECPRAQDVRMLFRKTEHASPASRTGPTLKTRDYQGRTWLTRPYPQIDRVGSAWLIRTFIDPKAKFVFGPRPSDHPDAIPYDMADVEFTHQGDDCTFETLLKRFGLRDRILERVAEMVHDADLHDDKFHAPGAEGVDRVLAGLARLGRSDDQILAHGFVCFEALYAQVKAS
jgi:hypothetical protein